MNERILIIEDDPAMARHAEVLPGFREERAVNSLTTACNRRAESRRAAKAKANLQYEEGIGKEIR